MAGEINIKISDWQRVLQRFLMLRSVTNLLAPILHHIDTFLLRLSNGRLQIAGISGLPIIEVTAIGAKSSLPRTLPLAGIPDGKKYALIASNFGRKHNPAWYYNLKANPECLVKKRGLVKAYIAREADKQENKYYYDLAISYYIGYAAYKQSAAHRTIPVMVLEPKE